MEQPPVKKCLPLYSQDHGTRFGWQSDDWENPSFEYYHYIGQYCKSGLAFADDEFTAKCTTTDHIKFLGNKITSPFACDPSENSEQCQLFFNTTDYQPGNDATQRFVNTTCKCAMDGTNSHGFCGSVLGTEEYQIALSALKPVLERSNCHTLDRHEFRAHKDICGVGFVDLWKEAVDWRYRVNHWPYYNVAEPQKTCFANSFYDSL